MENENIELRPESKAAGLEKSVETETSVSYKKGDLLKDQSIIFRVIAVKDDMTVLCQTNTKKIYLQVVTNDEILDKLSKRIIGKCEGENHIIQTELVNDSTNSKWQKYINTAKDIDKTFGPFYMELKDANSKNKNLEIMKCNQIKKNTYWNIARRYLQSGFDYSALIDRRAIRKKQQTSYQYKEKTGRPSATGIVLTKIDYEYLNEAMSNYLSGRNMTFEAAYSDMCHDHYSHNVSIGDETKKVFLPVNCRPTRRQLRYFILKNLPKEKFLVAKTSLREVRNNCRPLNSDSLMGVEKPGDLLEMDEEEVNISAISKYYQNKVIGRIIVYMMIDVFSKMIVAISVTLENNSINGAKSCFLNLADDKVEYCRKYGIDIKPEEWPSGAFIPSRIRCDRGAEYMSNEIERFCKENHCDLQFVTPGTGSLKGNIEQIFNRENIALSPMTEKIGHISKRHDSRHHEQASLTIDQVTAILLRFVIAHNNQYMKNYPLSYEMMQHHVQPTPVNIWNFGCENIDSPRPITNKEQYMYSVMVPVKASINRYGINCQKLLYYRESDNDLRQEQYSPKKNVPFRADPRDLRQIYRFVNGKLIKYPLSKLKTENTKYLEHGLSQEEYDALKIYKKADDKDGEVYNENLNSSRNESIKETIHNVKRHTNNKTDNIRKNRNVEKVQKNYEDSIEHRIQDNEQIENSEERNEEPLGDASDNMDDANADFLERH